ncbi:hypothetical protein QM996_02315 [Sinorhizobium chiapasense]
MLLPRRFLSVSILIVALQELFVLQASQLVRLWGPTEYKEFFIALGLAIYGFQTWARLRSPVTASSAGRFFNSRPVAG